MSARVGSVVATWGLLALAVTACGTAGAPAAPAAGRDEGVRDDPAAWLARIQAEVSALRGLAFTAEVPFEAQSRGRFRQVVRRELDRELGPERNAALSLSLAHTGFLPRRLDLAAALEEAETTQ